jgi:hypothetical protein
MTGNLPLIATDDPRTLSTWANAEAVAVNQDAAAWTTERPGKRLDDGPPLAVSARGAQLRGSGSVSSDSTARAHVAECGGEPELQLWSHSSENGTLFNAATNLFVALADCGSEAIYDGCSFDPKVTTCAGKGNYSHFEFECERGFIRSRYNPLWCLTVNSDDSVSALPCTSAPVAPAQQWLLTPPSLSTAARGLDSGINTAFKGSQPPLLLQQAQQVQNRGRCLTSTASPTPAPPGPRNATAVFGRPLTSTAVADAGGRGSYAVLLLNDGDDLAPMPVRCDANCVAAMVLPASFPAMAFVRDLIAHEPLPPIPNVRGGFTMQVPGGGATILLKLCSTEAECAQPHRLSTT